MVIIINLVLCIFGGFLGGSDGKESTCNEGDPVSIPGLGRSPGGGHMATYFSYSCLENPHRQRSLAGYCPQGCKMLDTTEQLRTHAYFYHKKLFSYQKRNQDLESAEKVNIMTSIRELRPGC